MFSGQPKSNGLQPKAPRSNAKEKQNVASMIHVDSSRFQIQHEDKGLSTFSLRLCKPGLTANLIKLWLECVKHPCPPLLLLIFFHLLFGLRILFGAPESSYKGAAMVIPGLGLSLSRCRPVPHLPVEPQIGADPRACGDLSVHLTPVTVVCERTEPFAASGNAGMLRDSMGKK